MRVVFVDNLLVPTREPEPAPNVRPHLGLLSLCAVAREAGHQPVLYDPKLECLRGQLHLDEELYRHMARSLLALRPDVVGFTTLGCNFIGTVKVARHLKAAEPELPLLLGGPHATILHREILEQFPTFDAVVRHEAELTLLPVLERLEQRDFSGLQGVTWRRGQEVRAESGQPLIDDVDSLPMPAFDLMPDEHFHADGIWVEAGRGCPFQCYFCSTAPFFGRRYRVKSPERLLRELDWLHQHRGVTHFGLIHDLFTVNKHKVAAFCEAVEGRGYTWSCSARMDCVDEPLLEKMARAGCRSIYYGVETGSQRMQKLADKRMDLELFEPRLRHTFHLGMTPTVSFILGFPEETLEDQEQTLERMGQALQLAGPRPLEVQLHMLTPEPGTVLMERLGPRMRYDGFLTDFNSRTFEPDDEEVMRSHPRIFSTHFYYPTATERRHNVFVVSAWDSLRQGSPPVLAFTLAHYGGKLGTLLARLEQHLGGPEARLPVELADVIGFLEQEWGAQHVLPALYRHMRVAGQLADKAVARRRYRLAGQQPPETQGDWWELPHVLGPTAALVEGLPACGDIIQWLSQHPGVTEVPPELLHSHAPRLLLADVASPNGVRSFRLTEVSQAFLECFSQPRTLTGSYELLGVEDRPTSLFLQAYMAELRRLGVLEAVDSSTQLTARA